MGRQVINDGVELCVRTVRAFIDHIAHNNCPTLFRIAAAQHNLRRVASAANLLHRLFPGPVRQLRRFRIGKRQIGSQKEYGNQESATLMTNGEHSYIMQSGMARVR